MIAAVLVPTPEIVKLLVDAKADLHIRDKYSYTALYYASMRGNFAIVEHLLDDDRDAKLLLEECPEAVSVACEYAHKEVLSLLLKKGASVETADEASISPLEAAIRAGDVAIIKILVDNHVPLNKAYASGRTPLRLAAFYGSVEVVQALIDGWAGISIINEDLYAHESGPLQTAIINGLILVAKLLLQKGADLHHVGRHGVRSMYLGVASKSRAVVEWLPDEGASMRGISTGDLRSIFDNAFRYKLELTMSLSESRIFSNRSTSATRCIRRLQSGRAMGCRQLGHGLFQ
jgi:uncharacterized protein